MPSRVASSSVKAARGKSGSSTTKSTQVSPVQVSPAQVGPAQVGPVMPVSAKTSQVEKTSLVDVTALVEVGTAGSASVSDPTRQAPESAYVFTDQIGYLMRRAYQRHLAIFQQHACDPQLTAVQLSTLCALRDNGPSSQTELVHATGVDQATIRGIIDRLKARGLIVLSPGEDDRRKVIAKLTPKGTALLVEMVPHAHEITERTLDRLNPAERLALTFLLRKLIDPDEAP